MLPGRIIAVYNVNMTNEHNFSSDTLEFEWIKHIRNTIYIYIYIFGISGNLHFIRVPNRNLKILYLLCKSLNSRRSSYGIRTWFFFIKCILFFLKQYSRNVNSNFFIVDFNFIKLLCINQRYENQTQRSFRESTFSLEISINRGGESSTETRIKISRYIFLNILCNQNVTECNNKVIVTQE